MNGQDIGGLSFNELSEEGKEVLIKVVNEIREQWIANNRNTQFWFYPARVFDNNLTEQVFIKWLKILDNKGAIHFLKPSLNSLSLQYYMIKNPPNISLDPGHEWDWSGYLNTSFFDDTKPDSHDDAGICPCIAIDTLGNDLGQLIKLIRSNTLWGKFTKDRADRYSYDGVLLSNINSSKRCKTILTEFLLSTGHILSADEVNKIVHDEGDGEKRNAVISILRRELRAVSHDLDIVTTKSGHNASTYTLTMKQ